MVQGLLGGEKERTEARLRAALDGLQMAVGDEDASTANAMTNLALFLKGEGQHAEATELYTAVLETRCGVGSCTSTRKICVVFSRFGWLIECLDCMLCKTRGGGRGANRKIDSKV